MSPAEGNGMPPSIAFPPTTAAFPPMRVNIRGLTGATFAAKVEPADPVSVIYSVIRDHTGLEDVYFVFGGRKITDPSLRVADVGLEDGSTVHLVQRLIGGSGKVLPSRGIPGVTYAPASMPVSASC